MTHPVVVAHDGSSAAAVALTHAAHLARRCGAPLWIVHVVPDPVALAPVMPVVTADLEPAARELLDAAALEARAILPPDQVGTRLLHGPRVGALAHLSEHARMLVLGTAHRSPLDRLVTGSTASGVAARARCPVLTVPRAWDLRAPRGVVGVGIEAPAHAGELLGTALEEAAARGSRVVVVHAWHLPSAYDDLVSARVDEQDWSRHAHGELEPLIRQARRARPEVDVELRVVHGQPARVLQHLSTQVDLLVLVRRTHVFTPAHVGGTARAVLRESACPVEVVPPVDLPGRLGDLVLEEGGAAVLGAAPGAGAAS